MPYHLDMEYYCAIDGGGTSSKCIVSTKSGDIFESVGGSSNIYAVGLSKALENIQSVITKAFDENNADISKLKSIHIASAGFGDISNQLIFKKQLSNLFPNTRITTSDDAYPLLVTEESTSGICLISGTGCIAFGLDNNGNKVRSGGFGWRLGDEGSAFWIAKEAIRRTLYSKELIDLETNMDEDIISYFKLNELKDIIYFINDDKRTKAEIASFSTLVLSRAEEGDKLATSIIDEAINHMSLIIDSVIKRLDANHDMKIIISGGVVMHCKWLADSLLSKLNALHPDYLINIAEPDRAKKGALILAMKDM